MIRGRSTNKVTGYGVDGRGSITSNGAGTFLSTTFKTALK